MDIDPFSLMQMIIIGKCNLYHKDYVHSSANLDAT